MTDLNTTMRRSIEKLIDEKATNVLNTLEKEIEGHPTEIKERMLRERGEPSDAYDINRALRKLNESYADIVSEHVEDDEIIMALGEEKDSVNASIEAEIEMARSRLNAEIDRIKSAFELSKQQIRSTKETRIKDIDARQVIREVEIVEYHQPGLVLQIMQMKTDLERVTALEKLIEGDVKQAAETIDRSRSRLMHLVNDLRSRAKGELLRCTTIEETHRVLDMIPDSADVIYTAEAPELGLPALVERFRPSSPLRIAPPQPQPLETDQPAPSSVRPNPQHQRTELDVHYVESD